MHLQSPSLFGSGRSNTPRKQGTQIMTGTTTSDELNERQRNAPEKPAAPPTNIHDCNMHTLSVMENITTRMMKTLLKLKLAAAGHKVDPDDDDDDFEFGQFSTDDTLTAEERKVVRIARADRGVVSGNTQMSVDAPTHTAAEAKEAVDGILSGAGIPAHLHRTLTALEPEAPPDLSPAKVTEHLDRICGPKKKAPATSATALSIEDADDDEGLHPEAARILRACGHL